ncbi:MAG: methyltransferase domain-containing protein [Chloroflexi bacterium]|nr:methyltransferase domain-containing protein [Chloroflexota bacterium]
MNDETTRQASRQYWDNVAPFFDDEPDHGLRDPIVLDAWTHLLRASLPYTEAAILDIGCGTGSLSAVLAGLGHQVTGIDLSPQVRFLSPRQKPQNNRISDSVSQCKDFSSVASLICLLSSLMPLFAGTCCGPCQNRNKFFTGGLNY